MYDREWKRQREEFEKRASTALWVFFVAGTVNAALLLVVLYALSK